MVIPVLAITAASLDVRSNEADELLDGLECSAKPRSRRWAYGGVDLGEGVCEGCPISPGCRKGGSTPNAWTSRCISSRSPTRTRRRKTKLETESSIACRAGTSSAAFPHQKAGRWGRCAAAGPALLAGGAAATAALIAWAGYPASMVGGGGGGGGGAVWSGGGAGTGEGGEPTARPAGVCDRAVGSVAGVPPGGNSILSQVADVISAGNAGSLPDQTGCRLLCGRRVCLLPLLHRSNGLGLVASSPEALLSALFGEPVARADLIPGGPGLAGGLDLGGLQLLCRFSQLPGSCESANRPIGDVESAERRGDPPDGILGRHHHSVFDNRSGSMIC